MLEVIKNINHLLNKKEKKQLFLLLILVLLSSILESLTVAFLYPIINILQNPTVVNNHFYLIIKKLINFSNHLSFEIELIICFFIFILLKSLVTYLVTSKQISYISKVNDRVAIELYNSYISLPYDTFAISKSSKFIRNLTVEISNLFNFVINPFLTLISETLLLLSILVILFAINFQVSLFLILFFILFYFIYIKQVKSKVLALGNENQSNNNSLIKSIQETFSGIREIKLFNLQSYFVQKTKYIIENLNKGVTKNLIYASLPRIILDFIFYFFFVIIIFYAFITGTIKNIFPLISAFAAAGLKILPGINKIINSYTSINFGTASLNEINKEISSSEIENIFVEDIPLEFEFVNNLKFEDITFHYLNSNINVVDKINFAIQYNKITALIGESGSGKTTLMHIILGLLKPQFGNIYSNSIKIDLRNKFWYDNVGYLPQSVFIADDTIRNNITLFKNQSEVDDQMLNESIRLSQLDKFVISKEEKLDFIVGERGAKLSGGEIQRIGIARILYNKKKIIVFDEPTSSLDSQTENEIIDTIISLKQKYTIIIVTHNKNILSKVDIAYKLDKSGIKIIK